MGNAPIDPVPEGSVESPLAGLNRTASIDPRNPLGYGVDSPYSPVFKYPNTLNQAIERDIYLNDLAGQILNPFRWIEFWNDESMQAIYDSFWTLDGFDGYSYNNFYAAGN